MRVTATVRGTTSRITEIQGLRAIAVALVVAYHAGLPLHGGFVGVDAFFVISGYVITRLLMRELDSHGRIRLRNFYTARIRRLLPAASLVIVVTAVASMALQSPLVQPFTGYTVIGSALWMANGALFLTTGGYFSPSRETSPLLHMWSLAVEEQFYLVYPLLLAAAAAGTAGVAARRSRRTLVLITTVIAVSGALSILGSFSGIPLVESFAYYAPITRAWEFALGALVCAWVADPRHVVPEARQQALAVVGVVALLASAFLLSPQDHIPGFAVAVPTLGTALVLASLGQPGTAPQTWIGRQLSTAPLQRVGDLSYSWYLWHWPLIILAGVGREPSVVRSTIACLIGLGLSELTYRHVEERFRHGTRPSVSRLIGAGVGIPVALGIALIAGPAVGWGNPALQSVNEQLDARPARSDVCLTRTPFADRDMSACTFNATATGKPIILLGDSTAAHITDGLHASAVSLGRPLTVATAQSCAFVPLRVQSPDRLTGYCRAMYDDSVAWLRQQPPSTIVLENAGVWVDVDGISLAGDRGQWETTGAAKGGLWFEALRQAYADLRAAGHDVIQVTPTPFFGELNDTWSPRECTLVSVADSSGSCGESMTLAAANQRQSHVLAAEQRATRTANVPVIDIRPHVCRNNVCSTRVGDTWVFLDSVHLTVNASLALAQLFEEALGTNAATSSSTNAGAGTGNARDSGSAADRGGVADGGTTEGALPSAPQPRITDPTTEPDAPINPKVPDVPDVPDAPDAPDAPDLPKVPEIPDAPDLPKAPDGLLSNSIAGVAPPSIN
ncbi:MAG TPA: acyltransferase family protein [Aeromicrobium sp.]|nr:acyltransferase family protein [Aeromicrobium sp.]HKY57477.1 acyltransferase family protein [Aeromicrobium sp.]